MHVLTWRLCSMSEYIQYAGYLTGVVLSSACGKAVVFMRAHLDLRSLTFIFLLHLLILVFDLLHFLGSCATVVVR